MNHQSDRRRFLKQLLAARAIAWLTEKSVLAQAVADGFPNPVQFVEKPFALDRRLFEVNAQLSSEIIFTVSVAAIC